MSTSPRPSVQRFQIIKIAGAADVDPRTVRRVIDGKPTRAAGAARVEEELKRRGLR